MIAAEVPKDVPLGDRSENGENQTVLAGFAVRSSRPAHAQGCPLSNSGVPKATGPIL
jgi:hypothetical protein